MRRIFDFFDWLLSFALLAGGVFTIWVASLLIRQQNSEMPEDEVPEQWERFREAVRVNWRRIRGR